MGEFRGKKRYFHNIWRKVNSFHLELDNESWFNFYHIHLDWDGLGNGSVKIRREHIKAYFAIYKRVLNELKMFEKSYQSWILLSDEDAGRDAVYIHTPNPNKDNFPLKVEKLDWSCNIPSTFSDLINLNEFNVAHFNSEAEGWYIIQSKCQDIKL
ncbi:hypothetical protein IEC97_28755 [Neobacillus cucumis]|uniref:hypothetical protein n=1 Tax=Neobacillus cucumis TaxID=1740721 RepID=UPI0018E031B3|nr:hypothetical protein [Neobacillus cucumis]MBI0581308.1 hypothetical protein [Neobacillus cucumis]